MTEAGASRSPAVRRSDPWLPLVLGSIALAGAVYCAVTLARRESPRGLIVSGPSRVQVDHTDRSKPMRASFPLHNPTARPIEVRGIMTSCACTTARLEGRTIAPGQTMPLTVRVETFDAYHPWFVQSATVQTDEGNVVVWVTGALPPPAKALYYPAALYLEPDTEGRWPERAVHLRVPKGCAREAKDIRAVIGAGTGPIDVTVTEAPASELFREYDVRLRPMTSLSSTPDPLILRVEPGCAPLEIPVRIASRNNYH